jgi:hypothetical protein
MEWSSDIKNVNHQFKSGLIGFCGKIYPYIHHHDITGDQFFYNTDDFNKSFPEIFRGETTLSKIYRYISRISDINRWLNEGIISGGWYYKLSYKSLTDQTLLNLFMEKRVAYFAIEYHHISNNDITVELYPILKNFSFYKVFDTFSAFQKIEHYLTNELIRPDDMNVVISDKLKAQSKGFDNWSFRKEPSEKK